MGVKSLYGATNAIMRHSLISVRLSGIAHIEGTLPYVDSNTYVVSVSICCTCNQRYEYESLDSHASWDASIACVQ